jgi:hypothetical protein
MDATEKGDGSVEAAFDDSSRRTKNGEDEEMPFLVTFRLGHMCAYVYVVISSKTPAACPVKLECRRAGKTWTVADGIGRVVFTRVIHSPVYFRNLNVYCRYSFSPVVPWSQPSDLVSNHIDLDLLCCTCADSCRADG